MKYDYWTKYHEYGEEQILNELYVDKKYDNFKDEIYQYRHEMNAKTFRNELLCKVNEYMQSEAVKATRSAIGLNEHYRHLIQNRGSPHQDGILGDYFHTLQYV